jgi:hypothetical protein
MAAETGIVGSRAPKQLFLTATSSKFVILDQDFEV